MFKYRLDHVYLTFEQIYDVIIFIKFYLKAF